MVVDGGWRLIRSWLWLYRSCGRSFASFICAFIVYLALGLDLSVNLGGYVWPQVASISEIEHVTVAAPSVLERHNLEMVGIVRM